MDQIHFNQLDSSRLEQSSITHSNTFSEYFDSETLVYIDSGEFSFQSVSYQVTAKPGSLVFVRPGEVLIRCQLVDDKPAQIVLISFGNKVIQHFTSEYAELIAQTPRTFDVIPDAFEVCGSAILAQSLEHLFSLAKISHPQDILELRAKELLLLLIMSEHSHTFSSLLRSKTRRTSDRLRMFMDQHFKNDWKLEDFAREFGASLTTFKENFSEVFGLSPRAWISERRLLYAYQLLLSSEMSIVDVAAEAGFSSQSYFTQSYKRRFNETPSLTRRKSLNPSPELTAVNTKGASLENVEV